MMAEQVEETKERNKFPKASKDHYGTMNMGGIELECFVLDNKQRIISAASIEKALALGSHGLLPRYIKGNGIQKHMKDDACIVKFRYGKQYRNGMTAESFVDLMAAYMDAESDGVLVANQLHIAQQAKSVLKACAGVGVVALVDEATGYKREEEERELQAYLDKFLAKEAKSWIKTFPGDLRREIYRLKGWDPAIQMRAMGHVYNSVVYRRCFGKAALDEIRKMNPSGKTRTGGHKRSRKHHQHLSEDHGTVALKLHLNTILTLMRGSTTWAEFERMVDQFFPEKLSGGAGGTTGSLFGYEI